MESVVPVSYHVWNRGSNPLRERKNYQLELRGSDVLWVFLGARALPEGRFMYYKSAQSLPGSLLFVLTLREDFYQGMFEELTDLISEVAETNRIRKIIYVGISAGAYAALVLGLRGKGTHCIVAFAPQFRLDDPLTVGDRTIEPPMPGTARFDARYVDVLNDVKASKVRCEIFLGVHDYYDGVIVGESLSIDNPFVKLHYIKYKHDVSSEIHRYGHLPVIMNAAYAGDEISVPENIRAGRGDAELSARIYELVKGLERGTLPDIPIEKDEEYINPFWWNVKSRIRFRHDDVFGAIQDICRAISLDPHTEGHHVCAGHYFRHAKLFALAEASYKCAIEENPLSSAVIAMAEMGDGLKKSTSMP